MAVSIVGVWQRKFEKPRLILRGVALVANMAQKFPEATQWMLSEAATAFGQWLDELMTNDRNEAAIEAAAERERQERESAGKKH